MKIKYISPENLKMAYPEIHKAIAEIYPLGLKGKEASFYEFEGIRKIDTLINDKIVTTHNYALWEQKMIGDIKEQTGLKAIGSTYGYVPCLSGYIPLSEDSRFQTNLYFYISLAGDYLSVEIIAFDKQKNVQDIPGYGTLITPGITSITVSPSGTYEDIFNKVELYLRNTYKDYKFLPFYFDYIRLEELYVLQNDDPCNAISSALFSKIERNPEALILGDIFYGDIKINV